MLIINKFFTFINISNDIDLDLNDLIGPIPPELGNLSNLKTLFLAHNELSGSIPPELGNLSNLKSLNLAENNLSGSIPKKLKKMEIKLNISNNPLLETEDNDSSISYIIIAIICILVLAIVILLIYLKTKRKIYDNGNKTSTIGNTLKNVKNFQ
ncbi:hypothetical protein BCR36DRAFT_375870 [Piromyces finnis]|uniref:L domain-like protein n=1 Tax=Piromyces finnis TaxID=1754191 RepID=A0A1Y1UBI3_9FUNG|nr:hypothetical protein BCR36DRAFT_375870 [Piromyces finnis]|eukprot:ORX34884.1 hypothetical protein BCR36DRAFT_375870 [Piromyces finnis]